MKITITMLFLFVTTLAFAQYPDTTPGSDQIEQEAKDITFEYSKQLALTGVQIPLFKDKVEDYLVHAQKVKKQLKGKQQLDALLELQIKETLEMNDILTQVQFQLYKKLKPEIQPLKVVETKN